jgi:carboxyl-terminal processing protease
MLKDLVLTLERAEVEVPNVPYSGMVSEGVGYINLTTFTQQAADNISEALVRLKKGHSNLRGLILDLRGNGGGLLNEAVNIINIFVPKGLAVVSMRGKVAEWDKLFTTLSEPVDDTLAVVILVDKMSASASEVVSGSLQDLDRAVVMGQRTYGKGLVQNTKEVGYGAQVKLTTAKYYIPSGRCIQSVRYKDGEPVDIPDAERAQFRTRNGRLVLDGGGIKPDVVLAHDTPTVLVRALMEQHLIFDYVTRWAKSRPSIDSVEVFSFNAWDDFLEYTRERGFKYETKSEQTMRALRNSCRGEGYAVEAELARVDDRLRQEKLGDFERSRSQIIHEIEQEIVGRYYFHRGKVRKRLVNDSGVSAAVALINDMERYKALLSGN